MAGPSYADPLFPFDAAAGAPDDFPVVTLPEGPPPQQHGYSAAPTAAPAGVMPHAQQPFLTSRYPASSSAATKDLSISAPDLTLDLDNLPLDLDLTLDLLPTWDPPSSASSSQPHPHPLEQALRRALAERDQARMALSTMKNEVYTARQTEKRLRAERDEARAQVAFLKKERAAGKLTEQRLRKDRNQARVALAVRKSGLGGKKGVLGLGLGTGIDDMGLGSLVSPTGLGGFGEWPGSMDLDLEGDGGGVGGLGGGKGRDGSPPALMRSPETSVESDEIGEAGRQSM